MQDLRDYLSGRTAELDCLFGWVEKQPEEITCSNIGFMLDVPATHTEISRQLLALIAALVKDYPDAKRNFQKVTRHNRVEVWRRLVEPINEDNRRSGRIFSRR